MGEPIKEHYHVKLVSKMYGIGEEKVERTYISSRNRVINMSDDFLAKFPHIHIRQIRINEVVFDNGDMILWWKCNRPECAPASE
jgi:hypothetical protein